MGVGLAIALLTGIAGWVWGDAFLEAAKLTVHAPVFGEIHLTSALAFDVGVFMVVIGVGSTLVLALAETENGP
jgi:multicomponent K+:H+ antiporter subunit A